jgi:C-terminal binding-module, SLH-like, of glucodextranase
LLFVALVLHMAGAWAGTQHLITIDDPAGDDFGSGTLIYPQRADFQAGDLDILQLQISRDKEGFWFKATFRNPIRDPATVPHAMTGPESLASFARKGFYQFNIDFYVDTDRIRGSGNTFTLPGRQVRIDQDFAWERAVILTPRPELMRQQLLDALNEQFPDGTNKLNETRLDQSIIFPTRIRVHGKTISCFVPAGFFSGSDGSDWAVTAFVTGAMTTIPADFSFSPATKAPLDRIELGVMQPEAGRPRNTFGYSGAVTSPVVDLLGGSAGQQVRQLEIMAGLTGVSWGMHGSSDVLPSSTGASGVSAVASPAALTNDTIGKLFRPEHHEAANPVAPGAANSGAVPDKSVAKRLEELQQLFEQKLIDESEYKQQRLRILNEL